VQETYLRAIRSIATFRGEASVRTWLAAIARHVCVDHVRRRQRQRRLALRVESAVRGDAVSIPTDDGDVAALLDAIDPDRREAFVLTQVVGLSYEEAAASLGCPVGTVRSRVSRARADLVRSVRYSEAV